MIRETKMLQIGDYVFDPPTRRLCGRGGERRLSPKATGVLLALAETPGRVWSRDALLERVWPNVIVGEEVLTHAIAELRRELGDNSRDPAVIETIHKSGYRLLVQCARQEPPGQSEAYSPGDSPMNLESYSSYLDASTLFERGGLRNWEKALLLFADSIRADPGFAPAYAGFAKTLLFMDQHFEPRPGTLDLVLAHCATARRLAPHLGEPVAIEAFAHASHGNQSRARRLFGEALRLAPQSNEVHQLLGRACIAHLEPSLAPAMLERAAALRSDDFRSASLAAVASMMIGDFDRASANYALTLRRTDSWLQVFPDDFQALANRAHSLVHLCRNEEASDALETVCSHSDPVRHSPACLLSVAGELDRSMDVLEQSVDEGWRYGAWLKRDPCLDRLRTTPRFMRIARSINA